MLSSFNQCKNMKILYVSDLDGTLLNDNLEVGKQNLSAIIKMRDEGVEFIPVTGRCLAETPKELLADEGIRYIINSNGASIYNIKTGEMVLETKIKKVVDYKTNHYILEDEIDPTQIGEDVRFVVENHVALGSEIVNCDFKGTLRIKSSHTVRDSKLWLLRMWIEWEKSVEGPIPKNVLFENCDFYVPSPTEKVYIISAKNPVHKLKTDKSYHLGDIVFKGCRGLRKENFLHEESNFTKNSVEEVTIID